MCCQTAIFCYQFSIFCQLARDLQSLTIFMQWAEYREHQITFTTAALTMNTAISIFRRLNEEFISNFPQFDDHGEIIEYLHYGYCDPNSHKRHDKDFATYTGVNFKITSKTFFCDVTYELLRWFFMNGAEMPFYQQEQARTPGLHFTPDDEILLKCLSLFGLVISESEGDF